MNTLSRLSTCLLLTAATMIGTALRAQEATPTEAPAIATAKDVGAAIQSAFTGEQQRFVGRVSKKKQEADGFGGGGATVVVVTGQSLTNEPFAGRIELVRRGDRTLITSKSELPGVAVYQHGATTIVQTTVGSDGCDASTLSGDLPQLIDTKRLLKEIERAEWQFSTTDDQRIVGKAHLRNKLVRRRGGGGGMLDFMTKKVECVEVEVALGPAKDLRRIEFRVVRFDPNASLQRRVMAGELDGGMLSGDDLEVSDDDKSEEDFERDVYVLEPAKGPVSERADELFARLARLAKKDGF